ncbi:PorV/PorQ family protein, partial [bacterium]|nr:PorV/PorQ family protein [bacterium]
MKHIIKIALLLNVQTTLIFAQLIGDGTQTPFTFGVESRAYSLGNAAVAFPQDASAMFWNPAGMVVIDQQLFGVSMSTLFEGTQYQYGGLIIPTLATGTFGIGVVRIGTDDIPRTEWSDQTIDHLGNMDYWWGQLNLAYGLRVYKGLAVGVAFEANRIVLGDWSTNGFGLNSGIHYALPHQSGLLSNLHIGIAAHSIVHPQLSLGTQTRAIPMTLRGGMAKIFKLGQNNRMLMIADIEKPELGEMRYHMGAEFMFGSILAVRAGLNNGQMTFGCGVRYADISFDYATGQLNGYGLMPWTHRFSLNIHMGPTLSDKRAKIEEIRQHDIETRFQARLESDRQRRIREGLRDAREFLDKADYFNARLEVGSVLDLEPDHRTAKNLLSDIEGKEAEYQAEREAALLKEARQ